MFCGNDELFTCDGDYCGLSDELEMHTSNSSHHNVCVCVKKDMHTRGVCQSSDKTIQEMYATYCKDGISRQNSALIG